MCLRVSYKKKIWNFFSSLKSMKKGVGFGFGSISGSYSKRCGAADLDPDPHQNVTLLQHCLVLMLFFHYAYSENTLDTMLTKADPLAFS
jgi:hypothetical protein